MGTWEKIYETLLINEECASAVDLGAFYRRLGGEGLSGLVCGVSLMATYLTILDCRDGCGRLAMTGGIAARGL